jgi:4-carboxymuconolactone decarboxylase
MSPPDHPNLSKTFISGTINRRRVLGDAWVDKAQSSATAFNAEFQNFITRYAWQEIWGRPLLGDKTRRLMVLSSLIALAAWEEFEMHVRAAMQGPLEGQLSVDEIKEVIMQSAIYCGLPKANHAFKLAGAILKEQGKL